MKIKIFLTVTLVVIIGFFIWESLINIDAPREIIPPKNKYIARIENEIDSLGNVSTNVFCSKFHKDIHYHISEFHNLRLFGKTENDNNQWKEILSRKLYTAYATKFAEQAMFVFKGLDWKIEDLILIRSEVKVLQSSAYLEQGSIIGSSFNTIINILLKHDEIETFISFCKRFSYSNYGISDWYPDVSDKIQKSSTYLANNLDNQYVNNCTRLKDGLEQIPQLLYNKHVNYLSSKIQQNCGRYTEYSFHSEYSKQLYSPLREQVIALRNDMYRIGDIAFSSEKEVLEKLLNNCNRLAWEHFDKLK